MVRPRTKPTKVMRTVAANPDFRRHFDSGVVNLCPSGTAYPVTKTYSQAFRAPVALRARRRPSIDHWEI